MLILSRKTGEKVLLSGGISVTVFRIEPGRVRLGIQATGDVEIMREELVDAGELDEPGDGGH